jgi:DNA-binding LacI/PurR family transcriptional regulator
MAVTLKDIAARTGLSIPTVHQIISGYAVSFSKETRKRVLEVAKEMDYRPNLSARSLQQRKSFLLGVLFYSVNNDYASDFARGLQGAARSHGYAPIFFAHANSTEELQNLEIVLDRHVDALIANVALDDDGKTNTARLMQIQPSLPMVEVFGRFLKHVPSVRLDFYAAGCAATKHLISTGHEHIALFTRDNYQGDTVPGLNWGARDFWRGYIDTVVQAGLQQTVVAYQPQSAGLTSGTATRASTELFKGAFASARNLLKHPSRPSAVICGNDWAASALLQYADRHPGDVPDRFALAVFGRGDSILPREWPVTLFRAPVEQLGAMAGLSAFRAINKETVDDVALPPEEPITIGFG